MSFTTSEWLITPDEYLAAEMVAEEKSEYFAGRVVPMAGALRRHSQIMSNVTRALGNRLHDRGYDVLNADMRVMAAGRSQYSYPDVVVVGTEEAEFEEPAESNLTNPILIVEILSRSTERVDRGEKFERYKAIGTLQDYLLVSQEEHRVEQYTRTRGEWPMRIHEGLDSSVWLQSLQCNLPLADIYSRVRVGPYPLRSRYR